MIISEMHQSFKILVDKIDSFNAANILPEEIDFFLQEAYEEFLEQRAYGTNVRKETFEETQKRMDDLSGLVTAATCIVFPNNSINYPNGQFVVLPDNYRHAVNEYAEITCISSNLATPKRVKVFPVTHDVIEPIVNNPFTKPGIERFYRLGFDKYNGQRVFEIVTDGINYLNSYKLRYIREPLKIDLAQIRVPLGLSGAQSIELAPHTHREIINIAVENALMTIGDPRWQTQKLKILEQE